MGQYCNTKILEKNWFHWLLSSSVPHLELYRQHGLLWTKVVGSDLNSKHLPNPRSPKLAHCIALATPIYLSSVNGNCSKQGVVFLNGKSVKTELPGESILCADSAHWLHTLDSPFTQMEDVIPALVSKGYIKELPTNDTWHSMLDDINKMCHGIAIRFKQPTEEEQTELANEALLQVMRKLVNYKLVYTPGLAPVFNLLTTTIHRCMYSIMNRRKTQRTGLKKFCDEVQAGIVPGYQHNVLARSAIRAG